MPSAWVQKKPRQTKSGKRYIVRYRIGGRESAQQFGGSFPTQREAKIRRDAIAGDLAALRVPNVSLIAAPTKVRTLATVAAWRESRLDVADGTAATHRVNPGRILDFPLVKRTVLIECPHFGSPTSMRRTGSSTFHVAVPGQLHLHIGKGEGSWRASKRRSTSTFR